VYLKLSFFLVSLKIDLKFYNHVQLHAYSRWKIRIYKYIFIFIMHVYVIEILSMYLIIVCTRLPVFKVYFI